jgi:hypothetical protein
MATKLDGKSNDCGDLNGHVYPVQRMHLRADEETDEAPAHQIRTQQYLHVVISSRCYSIVGSPTVSS